MTCSTIIDLTLICGWRSIIMKNESLLLPKGKPNKLLKTEFNSSYSKVNE